TAAPNQTRHKGDGEAEVPLGGGGVGRARDTADLRPHRSPRPGPSPPLGDPPPPPPLPPPPVLISTADFVPELGESITPARQKNVNRLAVQIVSMMEKPW